MSILPYMINIFSHCSSMGVSIFLDFLLYSPQIRTRTIITRTRQGVSTTQNDENNDNNNDNVEKWNGKYYKNDDNDENSNDDDDDSNTNKKKWRSILGNEIFLKKRYE